MVIANQRRIWGVSPARTAIVAAIASSLSAPAYVRAQGSGQNATLEEAQLPHASSDRSFAPEFFARFAPRNALDMLVQIPGFDINPGERMRGLGQASGNVLFNGQRPSSKSDDVFALLTRIPAANVVRIEIVDGASLDIPGLSGQVANIVFTSTNFAGQFVWSPEFRTQDVPPLWTRGSISASGKAGPIEYEIGLDNDAAGIGAARGPTVITSGEGVQTEVRLENFAARYNAPKLSGRITLDGPGSSVGHMNAHYQRIWDRFEETSLRSAPGLPDRERTLDARSDAWNYEIGGDFEFGLGFGRFKAIGLRRVSKEPFLQTVITSYADGSPDTGDRFRQTGTQSETIGRAEYGWKMLGGDWQLSGEAAFNSLDNVAGLFILDPMGEFVEVPFPGASGGVDEDRYEGMLSHSRKLGDDVSLQLIVGAEHSTIAQTGENGLERSFFRPKGSVSVSWKPSDEFDAALKLRRRVLQLSFYDFLARAFLDDGNQNSGNNDLRPQQDWSVEAELNKKWGTWGASKLRLIYRDVEDYVDIVPVGGGESVGNIDKAWAAAAVLNNTIDFATLGVKGLKLDLALVYQKSGLRDPFTGETRQWSRFPNHQAVGSMRYDMPDTDWAFGVDANYIRFLPRYRSNQVDDTYDGPWFGSAYVENKDVLGMTLRAQIGNILGARAYRNRMVYEGIRGESPVAFIENRDRAIGPVFTFSLRGNF